MTRTVTSQAFVEQAADILKDVGEQTFLIEREGHPVAAIIPIDEYRQISSDLPKTLDEAIDAIHRHMENVSDAEVKELLKSHREHDAA